MALLKTVKNVMLSLLFIISPDNRSMCVHYVYFFKCCIDQGNVILLLGMIYGYILMFYVNYLKQAMLVKLPDTALPVLLPLMPPDIFKKIYLY